MGWPIFKPEYTIHGLDDTETYYVVLTAFDFYDRESGYSNEVCINPPDGGDGISGGGGGCFIATAAYGSLMAPHVKILRELHDRFLLKNCLGKTLVDFYYKYLLPIADVIANHANLKGIVRTSSLFLVELICCTVQSSSNLIV